MLTEQGYKVPRHLTPPGSQRGDRKVWFDVVYDRSYVMAKIQRELITPLGYKDWNELQRLVSEAWKTRERSDAKSSRNSDEEE